METIELGKQVKTKDIPGLENGIEVTIVRCHKNNTYDLQICENVIVTKVNRLNFDFCSGESTLDAAPLCKECPATDKTHLTKEGRVL